MIRITRKEACCGCQACVQVCPASCIEMNRDSEGFGYPIVDQDKCIQCGRCEQVCPFLHPFAARKPLQTLSAYTNHEELRRQSSSGGVFTELAVWVLQQQGVVFGARFASDWSVEHVFVETEEELNSIRGSKYVQSDIGESFKQIRQFLKAGRWVLFSGTSCQVAALYRFLRSKPDRLLTVEVVCHGVPSPKVWKSYLQTLTARSVSSIRQINFRNKETGWKNYSFACEWSGGTVREPFRTNNYMKAFLNNSLLRPSCYHCPAKSFATESDLTLADYWGVHQLQPELDDDLGVGLVFVHTERMKSILTSLNVSYREVPVPLEQLLPYNPSIKEAVRQPVRIKRVLFYWGFRLGLPFAWLVNGILKKRGIMDFVKSFKK